MKKHYPIKMLISLLVAILLLGVGIKAEMYTVKEADRLLDTKQLDNIERAITILDDLLEKDPNYSDGLWVMAKAHLYLGDRSPANEKLTIYEQGKQFADRAVERDPQCASAHFWKATLTGRIGEAKGILNSLFMVRPLKEGLERALELDPEYADAYFALSQLYFIAPGFPLSVGNKNKALEKVEKAIELEPDNAEYQVHYARILIGFKRNEEAAVLLEVALESDVMEYDHILKEQAEELWSKIQ